MSETVGINVVFTDLVGSTEMSSRLGPEKTEDLRVVHFGLLRSAMGQHGGSEVKNLGDGLMMVFPSLGSALDGSVAMQQAVDRHNSGGKEPLGVRIGISTGDATEEEGDFFGEPVVEAARMCAKCDAGQIIVSQLLSMLARSTGHTFTSIGDLELRGVPEPVQSMTVDWESVQVEGAMPVPDRLKPDMERELAGRTDEMASLQQAFKDAEGGTPRVSLLAGEPGIGKTRLSSELAAEAYGRGSLALYGRCDEELSLPYQPWVEALGYLFEHGPEDLLAEAIRLHGPELAGMIPAVRRRFPDVELPASTDAETERYRLLQAVASLLTIVSADGPVLLVLDDLHWAGKPTLTMLRHVFTNVSSASLMIVGTYRDSDLQAGHPLIDTVATLRREPGVEQIPVTGLDDLEMVALVQISAGHDLDETATAMALSLRRETAGNPFFAHEILRNLVEVGDLVLGDDGRWVVRTTFENLTLPQSVRDVVGQRIARLGDDSLKALRAAAVIGKEFDLELLAEITGTDEDDLLDLLEDAVRAGILAEVPGGEERFRFLHTVARNALEAELSDGRKRRMHRKIAEALEASIGDDPGARVGELATHWLAAAAPVESAKAIDYARMAGRHAQESLAPDEAIQWFRTALEHLDPAEGSDDQVRTEVLVELGTAQQHAGDPDYRHTLLDAGASAGRIGDTKSMVGAALANNRGMYSKLGEKDDERIAAIEAALEAIGEGRTAERALLLATLFSELEYAVSLEERLELIDEATDIAREIGDRWVLGMVLNRSSMSASPQTLSRRLAACAEALTIAVELGDSTLKFWAMCGSFQASLGAGDLVAAASHLEALTSAASEMGRPSFKWVAGNYRGALLSAYGDADEEEVAANDAFATGTAAAEPDAFEFYAATVMNVRWIQGRSPEIIDQLFAAAADNPQIHAYTAVGAMMLAADGDAEEARRMVREAAERDFAERVDNTWSASLSGWSTATSILGEAEAAAILYPLVEPWCGQLFTTSTFAVSGADGLAGMLATVLGRYDEAEAHFAASEASLLAAGANFCATTEDLARAALHDAMGDAEKARYYANRSIEGAKQYGHGSVERRATEFLATLAPA